MRRSCPDEATLAAYLDGRLPPRRRDVVEAHAAGCERCLDLLAAEARAAASEPPALPPALLTRALAAARPAGRAPRLALLRWAPLGAAAIVAVVWGPAVRWPTASNPTVPPVAQPAGTLPPALPAAGVERRRDDALVRAPAITLPVDGATLPPGPVDAAWTPEPSSLGYDVQVLSDAGDIVWQDHVVEARARVAASWMVAGRVYYLRVVARLPDGRRVPSASVSFEAGEVP